MCVSGINELDGSLIGSTYVIVHTFGFLSGQHFVVVDIFGLLSEPIDLFLLFGSISGPGY